MESNQVILFIRELTNGTRLTITEKDRCYLYNLLLNHNCYYLLKLLEGVSFDNNVGKMLLYNQLRAKEEINFCENLFFKMKKSSVPYAVLKGFALSHSIYGSTSYRNSRDIDLLIKPTDLYEVNDILVDLGFQQGSFVDDVFVKARRESRIFHLKYTHQTLPYVKKVSGKFLKYLMIDLNVDVLWGESQKKCDMNYILEHVTRCELYDVHFFKLLPIFEFIFLCLHHYKDLNL